MKREVKEELGFIPVGYKFLKVFNNKVSYLQKPIPASIYILEGINTINYKNMEPNKCGFVKWMTPKEIFKLRENNIWSFKTLLR